LDEDAGSARAWVDLQGHAHEGPTKLEAHGEARDRDKEILLGRDPQHHSVGERAKAALGIVKESIGETWHSFIEKVPSENTQEWIEEHPIRHSNQRADVVRKNTDIHRSEFNKRNNP